MFDALIVNASPLIFLGNAGRIDLLHVRESARVLVPQIVFDEVVNSGRSDQSSSAIESAAWIEKSPVVELPA